MKREMTKKKWINQKKVKLTGDLIIMRIGQLLSFAAVFLILFIWWYRTGTDVLYFLGYWMVGGMWVASLFAGYVGTAIKRYKHTTLRRIYRRAHIIFDINDDEE